MATTNLELFRTVFKVVPTPDHPGYFAMHGGFMNVFLLDKEAYHAAERARLILEQLPVEILSDECVVHRATGERSVRIREAEKCAMESGFGLFMIGIEPGGVSEAEFLAAPIP